MTDEEKQRILAEARKHIADKDKFNAHRASPPPDPLTKWRREADAFAAHEQEAKRELRAEERRRTREAQSQALDPDAWDRWFTEELRRHLQSHLEPVLNGVAAGVAELADELQKQSKAREQLLQQQLQRQCDDIRTLQTQYARLCTEIAAVKTDRVLDAMPSANPLRTMN